MSNAEVFMFVEAQDCFGGTALDDTRREGHQECMRELLKEEWNGELTQSLTKQIITGKHNTPKASPRNHVSPRERADTKNLKKSETKTELK
jgi:hypothetical protein